MERIKLDTIPIAAAPIIKTGIQIGLLFTDPYMFADKCMTSSVSILKTVIIIADKNPVATENPMQGRSRFFI